MNTWDIKVLYFGKISAAASLMWPAGMPPLEKDFELDAPYLGFLLQKGGRNILIDTGINDKFIIDGKAWGMLPAEGGASHVVNALKKEGLSPEDIDMVLLTHLHNDHAGNCSLFKKARFVFQKEEWDNFLNPIPQQLARRDYDLSITEDLKALTTLMVDGDMELSEGIRLFKIPGHSRGSQAIAVDTKKGTVVFVGDLCLVNFMMFPGTTSITDMKGNEHPVPPAPALMGKAVPSSIIYDLFSFYESVNKIKAVASRDQAGYIIPGHEPSLLAQGI